MINFFDLSPDNLQAYIDEAKRYRGVWFFQHIPKTAGSSLVGDMYAHAAPFKGAEFDYSVPPGEAFEAHRRQQILELLEAHKASPYKAVSGHYIRNDVDVFRENTDTRVFTFLRHPVQRVISEYNYSLSDMHPAKDSFREKYPTIEHFIEEPAERNALFQFLCSYTEITGPFEEKVFEIISRDIFFFGLQEKYDLSYLILSAFLWSPSFPSKVKARKLSNDDTKRLYEKYHDKICEQHARDVYIYETVEAVMERIAEAADAILRPLAERDKVDFKPNFSFSKS